MRPSWIFIFRLIKIQKWCQKLALYATFSRKSDITRVSMTILILSYIFNVAAGGHLDFRWLDGSKYKNDARNGFSMPKLVGKIVLHSFDINLLSSYISNMATGGHFGFWFLTNSAAIFARVMGRNFFPNTSKSSNQVSNLTMLSVVTGPPDCTQLITMNIRKGIREYTITTKIKQQKPLTLQE